MAKLKPTQHPRRIAIFGGTFDPVHHGHLIGARDVLEQFRLDRVIFTPCARSPHKLDRQVAEGRHRLALLRAACGNEPQMEVSDCELRRPPPSYAIETVEEIQKAHPQAELFWIIGADQISKLPTWERYAELRRRVQFLVLDRPGIRQLRRPGVLFLPRPRQIDISATEIRARVARKLPIQHLVSPAVAEYITRHKLYTA